MGIFDRLGSVLKSYINDDSGKINWRNTSRQRGDPDLDAAFEELDDFLHGTDGKNAPRQRAQKPVPKDVLEAFAELGLEEGAGLEECREAYKALLKKHHPDRHAKHPGNLQKATIKTARLNAANERLLAWFESV
ncbi:MAG: J domain-containing protein [Treponema sp.]|nr:J domain-containing protein [Treponema sp.]